MRLCDPNEPLCGMQVKQAQLGHPTLIECRGLHKTTLFVKLI
jgi:hypothetical protein